MIFYVDGGVKDNLMYIGILSTSNSHPIKVSKKLGFGLSHNAEEEALYYCLKLISSLNIDGNVTIYCDQLSIVNIVNSFDVKERILKNFSRLIQIRKLAKENNITLKWISGSNNLAHSLVTDAYENIFFNDIFTPTFHTDLPNVNELLENSDLNSNSNTIYSKSNKLPNTPHNSSLPIDSDFIYKDPTFEKTFPHVYYVDILQKELIRKDSIIKDLMKIISTLAS